MVSCLIPFIEKSVIIAHQKSNFSKVWKTRLQIVTWGSIICKYLNAFVRTVWLKSKWQTYIQTSNQTNTKLINTFFFCFHCDRNIIYMIHQGIFCKLEEFKQLSVKPSYNLSSNSKYGIIIFPLPYITPGYQYYNQHLTVFLTLLHSYVPNATIYSWSQKTHEKGWSFYLDKYNLWLNSDNKLEDYLNLQGCELWL